MLPPSALIGRVSPRVEPGCRIVRRGLQRTIDPFWRHRSAQLCDTVRENCPEPVIDSRVVEQVERRPQLSLREEIPGKQPQIPRIELRPFEGHTEHLLLDGQEPRML